jgi:hypothetical protein
VLCAALCATLCAAVLAGGCNWHLKGKATVNYDANGATGGNPPAAQSVTSGQSITLPNNHELSKEGERFDGWNTQADGGGTRYVSGDAFTVLDDIILYAQWAPVYTVTYDANGAAGGAPPAPQTVPREGTDEERTVTVAGGGALSKAGCVFAGWNTQADGEGTPYAAGSTLTVDSDSILYAQWAPVCIVTYDVNDAAASGAPPAPQTVPRDGTDEERTITVAGALSKAGYMFTGWNTRADGGGTPYAAGSAFTVTSDSILYAQWAPAYTVTYDANGGTGALPEVQAVPKDGTVQARKVTVGSASGLSKPGCGFGHWNTRSDAKGFSYNPGGALIVTRDIILYAYWVQPRAFYNENGATSGELPDPNPQTWGEDETTLKAAYNTGGLSKDGWAFAGWSTEPGEPGNPETWGTLYAEGADLPDGTYYLYPQWDYAYNVPGADKMGTWTRSGGIIFYINSNYNPNYAEEETGDPWHYLEAAPADIGSYQWGGFFNSCTNGTAIGTGAANTAALKTHDHTPAIGSGQHDAALACVAHTVTVGDVTYTGWFLPSKDELNAMYEQLCKERGNIGGFSAANYLSSSESDYMSALRQDFGSGTQMTAYKCKTYLVRPVRALE